MDCWLCGLQMELVVQSETSNFSYWSCPACEVESCKPGQKRKPFKSGWRYGADIRDLTYWNGLSGEAAEYWPILMIDHTVEVVPYPGFRESELRPASA